MSASSATRKISLSLSLSLWNLTFDWQAQVKTPVEENLEEQVFASPVWLHTVDRLHERYLSEFVDGNVDVGHVGCVDSESPEAEVVVSGMQAACFLDLRRRSTDSFAAQVRHRLVAGTASCGALWKRLVHLDHHELAGLAIRSGCLQYRLRCRPRTCEQVNDNASVRCAKKADLAQKRNGLRVAHEVTIQQTLRLLRAVLIVEAARVP